MQNKYQWHKWFAWYPMAFGPHIVWLKVIQRRLVQDYRGDYWVYRRNKWEV